MIETNYYGFKIAPNWGSFLLTFTGIFINFNMLVFSLFVGSSPIFTVIFFFLVLAVIPGLLIYSYYTTVFIKNNLKDVDRIWQDSDAVLPTKKYEHFRNWKQIFRVIFFFGYKIKIKTDIYDISILIKIIEDCEKQKVRYAASYKFKEQLTKIELTLFVSKRDYITKLLLTF